MPSWPDRVLLPPCSVRLGLVVELDLLALLLPEIVDEVLPAHVQPAALALDLLLDARRGREGVVVLPMV
jgi:hypothetical protein